LKWIELSEIAFYQLIKGNELTFNRKLMIMAINLKSICSSMTKHFHQ